MKTIIGYGFIFLGYAFNVLAIIQEVLFGTLPSTGLSLLRTGLYVLVIAGGVHHFLSSSVSVSDVKTEYVRDACVRPNNPFTPDDHDEYIGDNNREKGGGRYAGFEWRSSLEAGAGVSTCITDNHGPSFENGCIEYERQQDIYEACKRNDRLRRR